jgi:hypothetical protein
VAKYAIDKKRPAKPNRWPYILATEFVVASSMSTAFGRYPEVSELIITQTSTQLADRF